MSNPYREVAEALPGNWGKAQDVGSGPCLLQLLGERGHNRVAVTDPLGAVIREMFPTRVRSTPAWGSLAVANFNDHADTTEADVISVLRAAEKATA